MLREKKINKLPYKDNIVFEKALIPLDKKKLKVVFTISNSKLKIRNIILF